MTHSGSYERIAFVASPIPEAQAARGLIPAAPDFSAPTHKRFRPMLAEIIKAAKAGSTAALLKIKINPVSSSPRAADRYRKLCVQALKTQA